MSLSNTFENELMLLIFNATAIADLAENDASSPLATLGVSLSTGDPGEAGTMSTTEVGYTNYARVNVNRNAAGSGWAVTNHSASPQQNIDFPAGGTGTSPVAAYFTVGGNAGGAIRYFFSGTVTPNITCGDGVTPRLTTATACTLD